METREASSGNDQVFYTTQTNSSWLPRVVTDGASESFTTSFFTNKASIFSGSFLGSNQQPQSTQQQPIFNNLNQQSTGVSSAFNQQQQALANNLHQQQPQQTYQNLAYLTADQPFQAQLSQQYFRLPQQQQQIGAQTNLNNSCNYTNSNLNYSNNFPIQGSNLLAGAQLQASSNQNQATILASQQQQPFVYQPPNTFVANARVASQNGGEQVISTNDPYNLPTSHLIQQQQQFFNNQFQASQQQNNPINNRPISQQQQHQQNIQQQTFQQGPTSKHYLHHQRSLPLPPPILQQLQARQQQQQLQRSYYQSANKLLFDDQRYYTSGSNPLLGGQDLIAGHQLPYTAYGLGQQTGLTYGSSQQVLPGSNYHNYNRPRSHRSGFNLESTRGFNRSLQSQWLYGGGRSSMAGDLLLSGQASALGDVSDADQKIINDFCQLYEESRQLFNGLRNLPQIGHKGWQAHFEAAFNAYTRLWRFQQQYRHILDSKYDLKRWQIGEIASKIGQLYYHYYLRTSDCSHLIEACNFYAAIRSRGYFSILNKDVRASLIIKKLRYYARYIVVCLLLKKMKLVKDLVREFNQSLNDYSHVYEPESQLEWSLVLQEIKAFIDAESSVSVVSGPNHPDGSGVQLTLSQRLTTVNIPAPLKMPTGKLFLSEALIVGNYQRQVKFSELTVDMYRLLQILEREPTEQQLLEHQQQIQLQQQTNVSPNHKSCGTSGSSQQTKSFNLLTRPTFNSQQVQGVKGSPHKYLLFRPTFSQLFLFLASGFKELPQNGVLLLYLSADGSFGHILTNVDDDEAGYELGGVATNPTGANHANKNNSSAGNSAHQRNIMTVGSHRFHYQPNSATSTVGGQSGSNGLRSSQSMHFKQLNCLHPGDLYPFTRKPLVLIVDSNNSYAFQHMPRHFGLPLLVLMSPTEYPAPFNDNTKGSLFTLFLHCPLTALCSISNIIELPETIWRDAQFYMDKFYTELGQIILQSRLLDPSFISLCSDDYLRLLIFRFIFCFTIMRLHRLFRTSNYYPRSYPPLPEAELLQHPTLKQIISDLTVTLDIRTLFD